MPSAATRVKNDGNLAARPSHELFRQLSFLTAIIDQQRARKPGLVNRQAVEQVGHTSKFLRTGANRNQHAKLGHTQLHRTLRSRLSCPLQNI
jgi:hypothetical protein